MGRLSSMAVVSFSFFNLRRGGKFDQFLRLSQFQSRILRNAPGDKFSWSSSRFVVTSCSLRLRDDCSDLGPNSCSVCTNKKEEPKILQRCHPHLLPTRILNSSINNWPAFNLNVRGLENRLRTEMPKTVHYGIILSDSSYLYAAISVTSFLPFRRKSWAL